MKTRLSKYYSSLLSILSPTIPDFTEIFPNQKIRVDGIKMNYVKIGAGKPLILIHGWANNWEGWIPLVNNLKSKFTLYLIDLPGFGDSGNLSQYSVEKAAEYVSMFIRLISKEKTTVLGLSMGSFVAAETAKTYPHLVESAILLGPLIKNGRRLSKLYLSSLMLRAFNKTYLTQQTLRKLVDARLIAYTVSKYFNMYKFDRKMVDLYGTRGKKKMRIETFIQMGLSVNQYNYEETLKEISVPTLLVYGREDRIAPYGKAAKLLTQNNNLKLEVIPDCGHMVHWEQTEKLSSSICKFLT